MSRTGCVDGSVPAGAWLGSEMPCVTTLSEVRAAGAPAGWPEAADPASGSPDRGGAAGALGGGLELCAAGEPVWVAATWGVLGGAGALGDPVAGVSRTPGWFTGGAVALWAVMPASPPANPVGTTSWVCEPGLSGTSTFPAGCPAGTTALSGE